MTKLRLPGLIDAHVHLREPGYIHKEDFFSGTAAALAGGVTTVLDMPNTNPPTATPDRLRDKARLAAAKAVCDVGLFVGATNTEGDAYLPVAEQACALKIYVSDTFGSLRIDTLELMHRLFRGWAEKADAVGYRVAGAASGIGPITVHAEELMLPVCLSLSQIYDVPLHIAHVSRRSEIELIRVAKERGVPVTCEVTPHHLFLSTDDLPRLGARGDMRPRLATPDDVAALWENLDVVDIFATDHAPHTREEKSRPYLQAPAGLPLIQHSLNVMLEFYHQGRISLEKIVEKMCHAPAIAFQVRERGFLDEGYWADLSIVDPEERWKVEPDNIYYKCQWSPFAGKTFRGRIKTTIVSGHLAWHEGQFNELKTGERLLFNRSR